MKQHVEEVWLGSGGLNALIIHGRDVSDIAAVVRSTVETPGNVPGQAERDLNDAQLKAVTGVAQQAIDVWKESCEKDEAAISLVLERTGDAGQAMKVQFGCDAGSECCMVGIISAKEYLQGEVDATRAAVQEDPLGAFEFFGG